MWSYQYKHGDRPLDGFTIQRAAGRGGFGEVYYALSDAGREVALKVVTGYEQIEVRGISQCMNLKSPNLVSIFDVKYNAQGKPFIIMEFVAGPSLRQLLDENPAGLGEQKAAFFLREMAKGLSYLHDCGIVHRDLKPGNVFYENGSVKIGDYGLSKAIATSPNSGQTVTVGTVHYMAPEVGAGKYDRGIDIYAMGAVLFEMLTGVPPFVGASPSEVLLKHLSAAPDCTGISEPFCTVIRKAMAKDPTQRYQSVQEMVEAVFGSEHVRQSMSVFSPEELSVVAGRVARHVAGAAVAAESDRLKAGAAVAPPPVRGDEKWANFGRTVERMSDRIAERAKTLDDRINERINRRAGRGRVAGAADPSRDFTIPIEDPLPRSSRIALTATTILIVSAAAMILSPGNSADIQNGLFVGAAITGAVVALRCLLPRLPKIDKEPPAAQRLLMAGVALCGMAVVSAFFSSQKHFHSQLIAIAIPLFLLDITRWLRPDRSERVRLSHAITGGLLAFLASQITSGDSQISFAVVAGIALAAQTISPWQPHAAAMWTKAVGTGPAPSGDAVALSESPLKPATVSTDADVKPGVKSQALLPLETSNSVERIWWTAVPHGLRLAWLGLSVLTLAISIAAMAAAMTTQNNRNIPPTTTLAIATGLLSLFGLRRFLSRRYYGIWHYLFRPLVMIAGLTVAAGSATLLIAANVHGHDIPICTFLIVFPSLVVLAVLFIPGKYLLAASIAAEPAASPTSTAETISPYKRLWAILLSAAWFGSIGGLQRFYVGKIGTGILWLCTGGLFGIGQLVDVIMILTGKFKDKNGRPLLLWDDQDEADYDQNAVAPGNSPTAVSPRKQTNGPNGQAVKGTSLGRNARGLLSALAGLLIFIGTIMSLSAALDIPHAVQAGVFGDDLQRFLANDLFNGFAEWPWLLLKVQLLLGGIVYVMAALAIIIARRDAGIVHQFRGLFGLLGLAGMLLVIHLTFNFSAWQAMGTYLEANQNAAALNRFLDSWSPGIIVAGIALIGSNILLGWPAKPRQRQIPAAPAAAERGE